MTDTQPRISGTADTAPVPPSAARARAARRRSRTPVAGDVLPQYKVSAERHEDALADSLPTMLRRLPSLAATAMRLAWAADRPAVLWLAVVQFVGGVLTAIGLYATRGALIPLFASGAAVDRLQQALPSLALITGAAVTRSLASAMAVSMTARVGPRVDSMAELRYLGAATRVPLAAYDDPAWCDHSEAANRASKDVHLMIEALASVAASMLGILAALGILATLHPALVPLLLLAVLPKGAAAIYGARAVHRAERHTLADRRLRHTLMYHTSGRATALDVRASTMRPWLLSEFGSVARRLEVHAEQVGRSTARYQLVGDALAGGAMLLVYTALVWLVTGGTVPIAAAGTAVIAVQTSRILLTGLVTGMHTTYKVGLYLHDWASFLEDADTRTRLPLPAATVPAEPSIIRAQNVTFTYPGGTVPALSDVSVTVRRGEVLAIVGANGSGKSTLAKLLCGLYAPTQGAVTWDGTNLADADPEEIWRHLAMLPQDIARWQTTARANITLGQGEGGDAAVMAAAAAASADAVLERLPDGLDTNLAPSQWGGVDLSGGQWQRLAAARAFYRAEAPLLVCDEPTSALDPRAEEAMYERIRDLSAGRTVILITHRLGSTRSADRILVLDKGHVIEEGTHEALLTHDAEYATMWRKQAQTYSDLAV
ncbi:ABC transporter ATP-binding protein [Streptomyces sp. G-G2]|uniref:ABC transporter ATP-binding protein n=1 Tax=Streptomyces sp. G-G2 TaxID=3046201 RepID=UPI0024B8E7DD|nr:ABC transporter ATP-binding protein [Streptomyces sp. G-G2]MDJ0383234.1 ABC transporter ATP-binding protein [Streptomyces sp. G-G2]